jgi:hypothetical protein
MLKSRLSNFYIITLEEVTKTGGGMESLWFCRYKYAVYRHFCPELAKKYLAPDLFLQNPNKKVG